MGATAVADPVAGATKTSCKGGWLDPHLRRANGRVGLSRSVGAQAPRLSPVWLPRPEPALEEGGWLTTTSGSRFRFNVCCGFWTGEAEIVVNEDGDTRDAEYSRPDCKCPVDA